MQNALGQTWWIELGGNLFNTGQRLQNEVVCQVHDLLTYRKRNLVPRNARASYLPWESHNRSLPKCASPRASSWRECWRGNCPRWDLGYGCVRGWKGNLWVFGRCLIEWMTGTDSREIALQRTVHWPGKCSLQTNQSELLFHGTEQKRWHVNGDPPMGRLCRGHVFQMLHMLAAIENTEMAKTCVGHM